MNEEGLGVYSSRSSWRDVIPRTHNLKGKRFVWFKVSGLVDCKTDTEGGPQLQESEKEKRGAGNRNAPFQVKPLVTHLPEPGPSYSCMAS